MLETIITEAVFYLGLLSQTFTIHKATGERGGISLTPHEGQTFLDQGFMARLF